MRPSWASLCLGIALAAIGAFAVVGFRTPFQPSWDEVLVQDAGASARWDLAPEAAAVASVLAALLARVSAFGAAAGSFGSFVVVCAAGGLVVCGACLSIDEAGMWALVVVVAIGCVIAGPFLRERGLLSLAIGGALAALPHVLAFRAANGLAIRAVPLAVVAEQLARTAAPTVGLLLGDGIDDRLALAIGLRMAPPFTERAVPMVSARMDSAAGSWLRRLPVELLQLRGARCEPLIGAAETLRRLDSLDVSADRSAEAARPLRIRWRLAAGATGAQCVALTPFGAVEGEFDEVGEARFDVDAVVCLRRWIAAMPTDGRIFVVAVPPSAADPPGWFSFVP